MLHENVPDTGVRGESMVKEARMQIKDLAGHGFDLEEAMELCIGDEEIYKEVLETALEEGREKIPLLKNLMETEDYERYIIEAHGLKNAAKQIGAVNLSEIAKKSELEGKAGHIGFMKENHERLLSEYSKVVEVLQELF